VRNLPDGRVEVVAVGPREILVQFIEDLRQGPSAGIVRECQMEWRDDLGVFTDFVIVH
jgi:acylphosphatase